MWDFVVMDTVSNATDAAISGITSIIPLIVAVMIIGLIFGIIGKLMNTVSKAANF